MDLILIVAGIIVVAFGLTRKDKKSKITSQGKKIALAGAVISIIGVAWFMLGFAVGYNNARNMYKQQNDEVMTEQTNTGYTKEIVDEFVNSCITSSGLGENARNYCNCASEKVQANYTPKELVELGAGIQETGKIPEEFTKIISACTSEL